MIPLVQIVVGIAVVFAPCPAYAPLQVSCYEPVSRTIYVKPTALTPRFTLMHEYGHAWDLDRLTETDRLRIRQVLGFPSSAPWWGAGIGQDTMSPGERFADGYAHCALGTRRRNRRLCALLPRNGYRVRVRPTS